MTGTASEKVEGACRHVSGAESPASTEKRKDSRSHDLERCWLALLLIWLVKETLGFV